MLFVKMPLKNMTGAYLISDPYLQLLWELDLNVEAAARIDPVERGLEGGEGKVVLVLVNELLHAPGLLGRMVNLEL